MSNVRPLHGSGLDELALRSPEQVRAGVKLKRMCFCRCCAKAVEGKGIYVKYAIGADVFCSHECRDAHERGACRCDWN